MFADVERHFLEAVGVVARALASAVRVHRRRRRRVVGSRPGSGAAVVLLAATVSLLLRRGGLADRWILASEMMMVVMVRLGLMLRHFPHTRAPGDRSFASDTVLLSLCVLLYIYVRVASS